MSKDKKTTTFWSEEELAKLREFALSGPASILMDRKRFRTVPLSTQQENEAIDFIAETMELPFSDALLRMIDLRGKTDPEVYKDAKIDRRVFSKLRSSPAYQPSRSTAIRLCLALHLLPAEAMALLEKAGFCLSRSKREDIVVLYCLQNHIYDVDTVNDALEKLGLEVLC